MLNHSKGVSHILHYSIKRLKSHTLVDKTSYQNTMRRHSWRQEKQNLGTTHLNLGYHNGTIIGWRQTYYAPNFYSTLLSDELLINSAIFYHRHIEHSHTKYHSPMVNYFSNSM
ncbi:hypothetical protein E3Q04_00577 [Wallemia mellicola]|nr:hypothetical protein E3Q04_00577 [Wallemia mellicola]